MVWNRIKIKTRIGILVTLPLLAMAGVGVWTYETSTELAAAARGLRDETSVLAERAYRMKADVVQVQQWLTDVSATRGLHGLDDGFREAEASYRSLLAGLQHFREHFSSGRDAEGVKAMEAMETAAADYYRAGLEMARAYVDGGAEAGNRLMGRFDTAAEALKTRLDPFVQAQLDQSRETTGWIAEHLAEFHGGVLWAFAAAGAVLLVLGALIGRGISRPLSRITAALKDISVGDADLTRELPLNYRDCSQDVNCGHSECASYGKREACWSHVGSMQMIREKVQCPSVLSGKITDCSVCPVFRAAEQNEFDALANWFNVFVQKIRYIVLEVKGAGSEMAAAAEQLSATTSQIATSNEEAAAQSQAVATGAEEMSATVGEVARNTAAVSESADRARKTASEGGQVVTETVSAVREIASVVDQAAGTVTALGQEAEKVGMVVQVIEDIADQTNLLALNAAIEAARAGEQGRGFAVVADEVRKLAEKTVKATQEIAGTIGAIQAESRRAVGAIMEGNKTVTTGRERAAKAGEAIRDIEDNVDQAAQQSAQIAAAIEQIAVTIRDMSGTVEQLATGAEESSAATLQISQTAQAVARKAGVLQDLTNRFRT